MTGIISDTHGVMRPEAVECLHGVDLILHAGDVGSGQVLSQLGAIAPVRAVRGNVDIGPWARNLPLTLSVDLEGVSFFLIHDIADLRRHPSPTGTGVVVYGHSHKPSETQQEGITYLNPGSAGPRRFSLPVTLVLAQWEDGRWKFSLRNLTGKS